MANSSVYGTIAKPEKNDFDKFMDDMNAIVGGDLWGGQSSSGSSSTSASTNSSKNSSGTTAIATNPNYSGIKDLAQLRADTALKGQQDRLDAAKGLKGMDIGNEQYQFDKSLSWEKEKTADNNRYNRTQNRNAGFEAASQRQLALNAVSADRKASAKEARLARRQQDRVRADAAFERYQDKMRENQQSNRDYLLQREQLKQNNKWKDKEVDYRDRELGIQENKYNAEIAALKNQNQQQWASMALNYANSAMDRGLRERELQRDRDALALDRQARAWSVVGSIFS